MPFIETGDGTRLFCKDWGTGEPVLFVHGWTLGAGMWEYQMTPLAAQGLRCIAYELRGSGRSEQPGHGYDPDTLASDLAAVIEQLDLQQVTLVGHSMGSAQIARYLSGHHAGRVARVVFVATTLPFLLKTGDNPHGVDAAAFDETLAAIAGDRPRFAAAVADEWFGNGLPGVSVSPELQPPKLADRGPPARTSQPKGASMGSNASASSGHLDMTIMLAFHDAFRRDVGHLARAAAKRRTDLEEPARRTAIRTGWELFKAQLHLHHTGEDSDLWPRMRAHLAGRADDLALLQAMEDEHGRISPILAAIDQAFADRDTGHQRLAGTVDALTAELPGHLAHEERDALPLVQRSLTQAEWQAFERDQRRRTGIRGAAQFFPWLLDGASAEQAQAILREFPPPLGVVYRRIWQPRYARHDHWEPSTTPASS